MRSQIEAWRGRVVVVLCAMLVGALAVACGTKSAAGAGGGAVDRGATLKIGIPVTQSLDPTKAPEPAQLKIATWPVYDRLIQVSPRTKYEPMLATKWTFSGNGETLTLRLRRGVTFSDGTPFDAKAVKANLDFYMAAENSTVAQRLANVSGVDVVSSDAVKIHLHKPSTTILSALSSELGGIMISPKALRSGNLGSRPVGTGAYVIQSYQPGRKVVYTRRTDKGGIWDPRTGKPAKIVITTYSTVEAKINALKSGQADVIVWASGETKNVQSAVDAGRIKMHVMHGVLNMTGMNLKPNVKPFDNVKVRRAVNYAINRKALVKAFYPVANVRVQPWPEGLPGFASAREKMYSYDPEQAKKLLALAGYPHGVDGGEFLVANVGSFPEVAQAIQANLAAVGIHVTLREMNVYTLVTQFAKSNASGDLMYLSLPSINAYSWLNRLFVNKVWSPAGPTPTMAKLVAGVDDPKLSRQQRAEQVGKAVEYATTSARYTPLWQGTGGYMASSKVKGLDDFASVNGGVADFRWTYVTE